jgi:hypothetical protein
MPSTAKERAERLFRWKQEGVKAASAYEAKEQATRLLTAKLRTERLARSNEWQARPEESRESVNKSHWPAAMGDDIEIQCPTPDRSSVSLNIRFWHLADIPLTPPNVRFCGRYWE